jgi:hypothetical protein
MKSASASLSVGAFAEPDAGFDYFGTAAHCRHLAGSIVDALSRGSPVLVTGDPAPDLPMLAGALRTAVAPRQVIEVPCVPDLDQRELFGAASTGQEPTLDDASDERALGAGPGSPVLVFGDADRLSDLQIKDILEAAQTGAPELRVPKAAVVLARPAFLDRFETPLLHILKDGFAARLSAQHLDRDEVEAFIRHQLPTDQQASLFTAQRVALIAVTSGGDPAAVNRLARRLIETEPGAAAGGRQAKRSQSARPLDKGLGAEPRASGDGEEIAKPQTKRRRYGAALELACVAIGAAALWLVIATFDQHQLGTLVGLIRSRISPADGNTASAEVPPRAATTSPPAVTQTGSSPVAPRAASPTATTDRDAAAEPMAPANTPGAAAPSSPAPPAPPNQASRPPAPEPPAPSSPASPKAAGTQLSPAETAALVARGDAFLGTGDITSARAFFERAADAGDSQAAMRMAVTFDPAFLERAGLQGVRGDPEQATRWYRRARELGGTEPDRGSPETGPPGAPPTR